MNECDIRTHLMSRFPNHMLIDIVSSHLMAANVMDIATTDVVAVTTQTSLDKACEILSSKRIKKVPVLNNGEVVGTLSRSDIVRALMGTFVDE